MKRFLYLFVALLLASPAAFAQTSESHVELGIFGEYFRLTTPKANFAGVGGRIGFNLVSNVQLEADAAYDFNQVFTEGFSNSSTGGVTQVRSNLRILHMEFGPKFQTGHGPVRFFATFKGGFINFRFDPRPATFSTFTSSVQSLRDNTVDGVFYPGGGFEAFIGPIGLRFDAGDEMFFDNGAHNNLRVTFGPSIRF